MTQDRIDDTISSMIKNWRIAVDEKEKLINRQGAEIKRLRGMLIDELKENADLRKSRQSDIDRYWDNHKPTPNSYGLDENY